MNSTKPGTTVYSEMKNYKRRIKEQEKHIKRLKRAVAGFPNYDMDKANEFIREHNREQEDSKNKSKGGFFKDS